MLNKIACISSSKVGFAAALAATALFCGFVSLHAEGIKPDLYQSLQYRHIGPQGNRTVAVAGVPGDPNTIYAGAASGGVFKTQDGGVHWIPIFDIIHLIFGKKGA